VPPPFKSTYSPERLRRVVLLLTIVTLPVVIGAATLIYYYLHYSLIVEKRLQGEHFRSPSRLYARPMVLRPGMRTTIPALVQQLNGLKYEQKGDIPQSPGEFIAGNAAIVFYPRRSPDAADEPVVVALDKDHIRDLRGARSKKVYATQTLEPELITYLFDTSQEKRRIVKYEELPDVLIKAVLATEDRRFFSHPGLDPFRILGAALHNLRAESYIQGGSTITQQLVKNFFLTPERTFKRKAQEAVLAFVLERRIQKKDILELYLNEIYLGQVGSFSINGVGEAARMYFHKDVGNLTLTEAALLAGMIQSPNPYNPYRHADRALERRNVVLHAMQDAGFIEPATAQAAMAQPLQVEKLTVDTSDAPYFVDLVRQQLGERFQGRDIASQNLSVYTTIDLPLQALAQQALERGLAKVDAQVRRKDKQKIPVQGALIALEPSTGAIVALVGGRSYGESQYNRALQAKRQPGSTFKPFVYLTAFEATFDDPSLPPITPATVIEDAPTTFFFGNQEYIPQNYENDYKGFVTLRRALASSLNVATLKVAEMVGYQRVADMWTKKLGISQNVKPYPSMALGAFEATPLEMATAYNVLANYGMRIDPSAVMRVTDDKGMTLAEDHPSRGRRVVHAESAFLVTHMLRSVLNGGTATAARTAMGFTYDAAGKTGTTNDMRDAWFAGYTPDLLCIVWVGFDDNMPINLSGAKAALPIWVDFMKGALGGMRPQQFTVPAANVIFVDIDAETGQLATPYCPKTFPEAFIAGTEPHEPCQKHSPDVMEGDPDSDPGAPVWDGTTWRNVPPPQPPPMLPGTVYPPRYRRAPPVPNPQESPWPP
jgi:penicillin-binding protein 1B